MDLVRLKITQKVINHLRFRHKVSRTDQCLPTKVVAFAQMRKQILYIKNSLYIIPRFGIYRNTGIGIFHNTFQHFGIRSIDFQVHHIQPGSHHFLSRFLAKTDNTFQNIAFLWNLTLVRQFQSLWKLVDRNIIIPFCHTSVHQKGRTDQQCRQRWKEFL